VTDLITFEYPLHERSRTLLRLTHCFNQFDYHIDHQSPWETRAAMSAMLDISSILARADIKSDLIKEMERQTVLLGKMRQTHGVDPVALEEILQHLNTTMTNLHNVGGQLGKQIRDHEFLKSILQRSSLPGGDCDFDLPLYYQWLEMPFQDRQGQLLEWIETVKPLRMAVELLLHLTRGSAVPKDEIAENGFFQKTLDGNVSVQLLRIEVSKSQHLYPEISGSKHRFNIRFIETLPLEHPQQTQQHVNFQLTTCIM
jgi:cell division protein ZapD